MKKNINYTFYLIIILVMLNNIAFGQISIFSARASPLDSIEKLWKISVIMSSIKQSDVVSIALIDGKTGKTIQLGQIMYISSGVPSEVTGFNLNSLELNRESPYVLVISVNKRKTNGEFEKITSTSLELSLDPIITASPMPVTSKPLLQQKKSSSKKDSDVYIALEAVGANKSKTFYSTDIKIEPRFGPKAWNYIPFFHLNTSTKPKADPDKMDIGFKATRLFPVAKEDSDGKWNLKITDLELSLGGKIESERDFENTNLLFDPNLTFLISPIPLGKKATLTPNLFIGTEFGKNLKSPLQAAEGKGIARIFGGAYLLLDIPIERPFIQGLSWETSYTRRLLLKNEIGFETDDDDKLVLAKYGKSPRDHITSKLSFIINDFFNPFIEYEWGEVPPSYKLVNHSFKVGISYKFKLNTK